MISIGILAVIFCMPSVLLGQGPENVLLVVNQSSPVSGKIADYYAARRLIPKENICRLKVTEEETIQRDDYTRHIEQPIVEFLKSNQLEDKILYIVTTLGLPLKIAGPIGLQGEAASVDSELTLAFEEAHGGKHATRGPVRNPFYRRRYQPFRHPTFPMYLVTRLAGYDFESVKGLIDRSLKAANRGRFVLDLKSAGDEQGNDWLRTAAILLPKERVVIEESEQVLYEQKDVIGYAAWGSNDPNRKQRRLGFKWLPGAIVTEYVSTNGRTFKRPPDDWQISTWQDKEHFFAGAPQTLTADYIEEGATGASGHVYEPFLSMVPRPQYLFPAYMSGRNLAESYYLSIPSLSWTNIVVGDPLCSIRGPE